MSSDDSTVIGVVILARHGDREGFYQDPNTYTASSTTITPLGEVRCASTIHCMRHCPNLHSMNVQKQEFQLGTTIRNLYFDPLPDMEPKQQVNRIAKNMIESVALPVIAL